MKHTPTLPRHNEAKRWRALKSIVLRLAVFVAVFVALFFPHPHASVFPETPDFASLDLSGYQRVLVIAPHPDDETLTAGGVIQQALAQGSQVRVVFVTNGDGHVTAPLALNREYITLSNPYVSLGRQRHQEAIAAALRLGLTQEQLTFLGYPDIGIGSLWIKDWKSQELVRGIFTQVTRNPYTEAALAAAREYTGQNLFDDLYQIIRAELPDLILTAHPNDDNADHVAVYNFTSFTAAQAQQAVADYHPTLLAYLTHYGAHPSPRCACPEQSVGLPRALAAAENTWLRFELTPQQRAVKGAALRAHTSQVSLRPGYLNSFVRRDELFMLSAPTPLRAIDFETAELSDEIDSLPVFEPRSETLYQNWVKGADLTGMRFSRLGNTLIVRAATQGATLSGLEYRILLKTPDGNTRVLREINGRINRDWSSYSAVIDLDALGNPSVLGVAAEIAQGVRLDHTGWFFLRIE